MNNLERDKQEKKLDDININITSTPTENQAINIKDTEKTIEDNVHKNIEDKSNLTKDTEKTIENENNVNKIATENNENEKTINEQSEQKQQEKMPEGFFEVTLALNRFIFYKIKEHCRLIFIVNTGDPKLDLVVYWQRVFLSSLLALYYLLIFYIILYFDMVACVTLQSDPYSFIKDIKFYFQNYFWKFPITVSIHGIIFLHAFIVLRAIWDTITFFIVSLYIGIVKIFTTKMPLMQLIKRSTRRLPPEDKKIYEKARGHNYPLDRREFRATYILQWIGSILLIFFSATSLYYFAELFYLYANNVGTIIPDDVKAENADKALEKFHALRDWVRANHLPAMGLFTRLYKFFFTISKKITGLYDIYQKFFKFVFERVLSIDYSPVLVSITTKIFYIVLYLLLIIFFLVVFLIGCYYSFKIRF